jgi:hypothetical protein
MRFKHDSNGLPEALGITREHLDSLLSLIEKVTSDFVSTNGIRSRLIQIMHRVIDNPEIPNDDKAIVLGLATHMAMDKVRTIIAQDLAAQLTQMQYDKKWPPEKPKTETIH